MQHLLNIVVGPLRYFVTWRLSLNYLSKLSRCVVEIVKQGEGGGNNYSEGGLFTSP